MWKKGKLAIRMVVDARRTNALHKAPPGVRLGSGAAIAELRFDDFCLGLGGWGGVSCFQSRQSGCDVRDTFYNFYMVALGSWFIISSDFSAGELGISHC